MISIFRKCNLKLTVISSDYFGHLFGKKFTMSTTSRLAQLVEHETLNLRVVGSSPTLGDQIFSEIFPSCKIKLPILNGYT